MTKGESTGNATIDLALDTIRIERQALVFVNTRQGAEKTAEETAKKLKGNKKLDDISNKILRFLSKPTRQCERLSFCVKKGIAFHHSGLTAGQRHLIEQSFRDGTIRIICCTPTLAAGLDLPAFRVILRDLKRFGPRGLNWIPVLEYLQMCGRAGRPTYDKYGEAIAVASTKPENDAIKERYLNGLPEDIYSKLNVEPVLRTYLLSLVSTRFIASSGDAVEFFSKTFWAKQFRDMKTLESQIHKMLNLLEEWEFIQIKRDDFVAADELGKDETVRATALGKRVAELYIDPLTANHLINCLRKAEKTTEFPLLLMISNTLEMRPLLRARMKEHDAVNETLASNDGLLLQKEPCMYEPEYEDFMHAVKTAMFFGEWIQEREEDYLLDNFNIRPGEIRVKLDTADWLLYASSELSRIMQLRDAMKNVIKLRTRIKYGVKEELFPLLRLKNIGRVRARKMFNNRIRDIGDIKKADLSVLSHLLGRKTAEDVKKQVGQGVKKEKGLDAFSTASTK
ncbi:MAG: hypothetical protein GY861_19380 [bacterium]|nr:hypothetical protein [bacterium]